MASLAVIALTLATATSLALLVLLYDARRLDERVRALEDSDIYLPPPAQISEELSRDFWT